jgi:hypothetical protein
MPDASVVLLIIGAVFLLIGLIGGGFELSAVKLPQISNRVRIALSALGGFLLIYSILQMRPQGPPSVSTSVVIVVTATPQPTTAPVSTNVSTPPATIFLTAVPPTQTATPSSIVLSSDEIMRSVGLDPSKGIKTPIENGQIIPIPPNKPLQPPEMYGVFDLPNTPGDFVLHATIMGGEQDDLCQVQFRGDPQGGYQVSIDYNGNVQFVRLDVKGGYNVRAKAQQLNMEWKKFDFILVAKQQTYSVYIDGLALPIISIPDSALLGGNTNLASYSSQGVNTGSVCSFSDVWIWTP